jgi:hypothetical protein
MLRRAVAIHNALQGWPDAGDALHIVDGDRLPGFAVVRGQVGQDRVRIELDGCAQLVVSPELRNHWAALDTGGTITEPAAGDS